jgi:hypothetical protein
LSILSPIALFVYNRLWHVQQSIAALQRNALAGGSDLYVFSDAARDEHSTHAVQEVRDCIKRISGFKSLNIIERAHNFGLAKSIIDGVTLLCNRFGRVVVLEDDMVTSEYFLTYMNDALERYASDDRVISIHGYVYPIRQSLPEAFFLLGADCWGWATWDRGWRLFNPNGQLQLDELRRRRLINEFDFNASYPYSKMMEAQIRGDNDSWAIRWYASAFLAGKLTLYPGRSLVRNIGNDRSGTHCGDSDTYDVGLSAKPIDLRDVPVAPSLAGRTAFEAFFRASQGTKGSKILRHLKQLVRSIKA